MDSTIQNICIITSVIDTGNIPWSYFYKRSVFTPEQRFEQTISSINSLRKYLPNCKILLVEGGKLSKSYYDTLIDMCDYVHYLGNDIETYNNCILSNCKGLGDSFLISMGLHYIKYNNIIISNNIYKLSCRYTLNENFNISNISNDVPTFKNATTNSYITFFFSVPYRLIDLYIENINEVINIMKVRTDICLEEILPSLFKDKNIVDTIGAQGIIAVDETYNTYKV